LILAAGNQLKQVIFSETTLHTTPKCLSVTLEHGYMSVASTKIRIIKETKVKSRKMVNEAYAFLGLTLALSWFVFWGPLALFKIPTISFVSNIKGPIWAIA
jgi:hypothetical protein